MGARDVTLPELHDLLTSGQVDWYYAMADDRRAYQRGETSVRHARQCALSCGDAGLEMFNAFAAHYALHDSEHPPLPPRPAS